MSRPHDEHEAAGARMRLAAARDGAARLRDLLWALLNTKEFIVNR